MSLACPGPLSPVCGVLGGAGSSVLGFFLTVVNGWFVSAAQWLLGQLGAVMAATTTPDLSAPWFGVHFHTMETLAAVVAIPMLLAAVVQGVVRQEPGIVARAAFVQLPLAAILTGAVLDGVQLALGFTDWLSSQVSSGAGDQIRAALSSVADALNVGVPGGPGLVVGLAAALVVAGAFTLWIELLVRAAAVYVTVLFLPLALSGMVWPAMSHLARRLVEAVAAIVLSKFVIVTVLSLAVGAVAAGTGPTGSTGGVATVLAGAAMLLLASLTPFTLLRLIPLIEASAALHLEGSRHRVAAAASSLPRTAAHYALKMSDAAAAGGDAVPSIDDPSLAGERVLAPAAQEAGGLAGSADGWGTYGKEDCVDPEHDDGEGDEPRYYWSDGSDGGPRGPRLAPHWRYERALRDVMANPPSPGHVSLGGIDRGWVNPVRWGPAAAPESDVEPDGAEDEWGGPDLSDPDLPPQMWDD